MTSVLIVLSAAHQWTLRDGTPHPTGVWAEEFVMPYGLFTDAGFVVTVATPGGKIPTIDRLSLGISGGLPAKIKRIAVEAERLAPVLQQPADLSDLDPDDYDLVFYSGATGRWKTLRSTRSPGRCSPNVSGPGEPWPFCATLRRQLWPPGTPTEVGRSPVIT